MILGTRIRELRTQKILKQSDLVKIVGPELLCADWPL